MLWGSSRAQNLLRLHDSFTDVTLKDLALELCLTLPTSLEKRVPYLPLLVKPLVLALKPRHDRSNDLIAVGCVTREGVGARQSHACLTTSADRAPGGTMCGIEVSGGGA